MKRQNLQKVAGGTALLRRVGRAAFAAFAVCALCASLCLVAGCCCAGYQIGPAGLYNTEIRTVFVPMVEADTYRNSFAERLTEAICKKITEQTPYALASADEADSVLSVKLTSEYQSVTAFNRYNDTRQKNVNLTAIAVWTDQHNSRALARSKPIPLNDESGVSIDAQSYLVAEMGQSTATAQQEAIDRLASQIVGLMETPW